MNPKCVFAVLALGCLLAVSMPGQDHPADAPPTPDAPVAAPPGKAPKPKSRLNLLRQMQVDLDMATPHAHVDGRTGRNSTSAMKSSSTPSPNSSVTRA